MVSYAFSKIFKRAWVQWHFSFFKSSLVGRYVSSVLFKFKNYKLVLRYINKVFYFYIKKNKIVKSCYSFYFKYFDKNFRLKYFIKLRAKYFSLYFLLKFFKKLNIKFSYSIVNFIKSSVTLNKFFQIFEIYQYLDKYLASITENLYVYKKLNLTNKKSLFGGQTTSKNTLFLNRKLNKKQKKKFKTIFYRKIITFLDRGDNNKVFLSWYFKNFRFEHVKLDRFKHLDSNFKRTFVKNFDFSLLKFLFNVYDGNSGPFDIYSYIFYSFFNYNVKIDKSFKKHSIRDVFTLTNSFRGFSYDNYTINGVSKVFLLSLFKSDGLNFDYLIYQF